MPGNHVLVVGSGHLAYRIRTLAAARGYATTHLHRDALQAGEGDAARSDIIARALEGINLASLATVFLVDQHDEHNLELLLTLISRDHDIAIVASLFNEHIAPHLQAAHPNVQVLNPAKIAAPAFIAALDAPLTHTLRFTPAKIPDAPAPPRADRLIRRLLGAFLTLLAVAVVFFHQAEGLSWLDSLYFVVVTVATVGYGDITLLHSSATSKLAGIALILASTVFIWMIFSLTVDNIIKRRVQLALGRKPYAHSGHVILCGLGRLGHFVAEGLLDRGERVLVVEKSEDTAAIEQLRARGADVYVGDARLPRVLQDVGVTRAKALYSLIDGDLVNLEIGLNARSFAPNLRLVLRIFDESTSARIREHLDIHLSFSMSAIADEHFCRLPSVASAAAP